MRHRPGRPWPPTGTLPREDWGNRSGGHGPPIKPSFRSLPSDDDVQAMWPRISQPCLAVAYGLMATYGCAYQRCFLRSLPPWAPGGARVLRVLPHSQTREHSGLGPSNLRMVELFELPTLVDSTVPLPRCVPSTSHHLPAVGRAVAEQFRRYGDPADHPLRPSPRLGVRTIHHRAA